MDKILVTGGAGYIGSHVVNQLVEAGQDVYVFDNLSTGHRKAVHPKAHFVRGDLRNWPRLREYMHETLPDGIIHLAGLASVQESMQNPFDYFYQNVNCTMDLLKLCTELNIKKFIFASTCNVYGENKTEHYSFSGLKEFMTPQPSSPYGESKLMVEGLLKWFQRLYGIDYVSLRFFNVAGAHPSGLIGEDHEPETHLIPNVIKSLSSGQKVQVYGSDYPTTDGTAVRDYVHVMDIAHAMVMAYTQVHEVKSLTVNLSTGRGYSVREVIRETASILGIEPSMFYLPRREGDPASLFASPTLAKDTLGWEAQFNLRGILMDAIRWHSRNPQGYNDKGQYYGFA